MKTVQHHHAMEALCRQRAQMDGVEDIVQLTEAEILARLSVLEYRQRYLKKAPKAPSAANTSAFQRASYRDRTDLPNRPPIQVVMVDLEEEAAAACLERQRCLLP
jgi:hypothetical protein